MSTSPRILVLAMLLVATAACAGSNDDPVASAPTNAPVTAVTTAPSASASTPSTEAAPATTLAETTVSSSSTTAPAVPQTTSASTTTTTGAPGAPPTTEALSVQELLLSQEGLGSALFGTEAESVVQYVTSILGSNTADTGWVAPDAFSDCLGTQARKVDWGVLSLLFTDQSLYADGRQHFMGWEYGLVGQIGDPPAGLRSVGGTTLGSRVIDLKAEYPTVFINEGEPESNFPDNYYVNDAFRGLLSGTSDEAFVVVMFGGYGCFE